MRSLSTQETSAVSGGFTGQQAVVTAAAAAGGYLSYQVASFFSPLSTVIGTVGTAVTLGTICSIPSPIVGTVVCGTAGAVGGYIFSSTLASLGAFGLGAAASGYAAYKAMS